MSRIFAAYSVGGLIGPALGAFGGIRGPFLAYLASCCGAAARLWSASRRPARVRGRPRRAANARLLGRVGRDPVRRARARRARGRAAAAPRRASQPGADRGALRRRLAGRRGQCGAAGGARPRPLVFAAVVLAVAGIALAGWSPDVPLWLLALLLAAVGIGLANTGSLGLLVEAVPVERIVTAMVVWSQIGIVGYLLGPLAGGLVADGPGYASSGPCRRPPACSWSPCFASTLADEPARPRPPQEATDPSAARAISSPHQGVLALCEERASSAELPQADSTATHRIGAQLEASAPARMKAGVSVCGATDSRTGRS